MQGRTSSEHLLLLQWGKHAASSIFYERHSIYAEKAYENIKLSWSHYDGIEETNVMLL
jgi:hypothetical protein